LTGAFDSLTTDGQRLDDEALAGPRWR